MHDSGLGCTTLTFCYHWDSLSGALGECSGGIGVPLGFGENMYEDGFFPS